MILLLIACYTKGDIKRVIWTYPNQPQTILKYILSIYWEPSVEHKNYENNDSFAQSWVASEILSISDSTTFKRHYNIFTCWASMDFDPHGDPAMPSVGTESQNPCAGHGEKTVHNNAVSVCIPREILKVKQKTAWNRKPSNEKMKWKQKKWKKWNESKKMTKWNESKMKAEVEHLSFHRQYHGWRVTPSLCRDNSVSTCTFRREIINSTLVAFSTEKATPVSIIKLKEAECC